MVKRKRKKVAAGTQIKVYVKNRPYHLKLDKKVPAKKPGSRVSASGKKYSERRENRSDKSRKTRL